MFFAHVPFNVPSIRSRDVDPESTSNPHLPPLQPTDVIHAPRPVLYPPPLLSSLPEGITFEQPLIQAKSPPLATKARLPDIDAVSLSLHKALHNFRPVTPRYADVPYEEAFNWSELSLSPDDEGEWYCVVFRSKRRSGADSNVLYEADKIAHEEAISAGGLLLYWYGVPDPVTGMNLATCIWQSQGDARAAIAGPNHRKAMELTAQSYETYSLERYWLVKSRGESSVSVLPYQGGVGLQFQK